ncbi:HIT family protein [Parageobacillus thermoglucosidasius]|uniref:HIT family protein n=1 Tax=Parageobacillus thermoglucosidasius TaxID=1426 RepID=UPI000B56C4C3|nr:HIT family protein [Parageobacillus thermoglucosidasius]MBY6270460.1 HIT family protein [Parageobacillus thermoglucosidasius]OUM86190.1 MAG: HIT family hydrolase [Parageobacillus thermoglucosidasius]
MPQEKYCLGCELANKKLPVYVVYEDEYVTCILDHAPFNDGHTLILPKKHFKEVEKLNVDTANAIMKASILVSKAIKLLYKPDGITICQNGGIFNELTHYHMHIVPRYENQSFADFYLEDETENDNKVKNLRDVMLKLQEAIYAVK